MSDLNWIAVAFWLLVYLAALILRLCHYRHIQDVLWGHFYKGDQ